MKKPYDTLCVNCNQTITACTCEDGPMTPAQDRACPVCGEDPNTIPYRKALWEIFMSDSKKDMLHIAKRVLLG